MRPGPVPRTDGPVVVSLTEFTARRFRDLPGIAREGVGLRRAWWAMPGAIGVILYVEPAKKRGGSLSVWETEADLRRFVALPRHTAIMRRYRTRVSVRAATWTTESFRIEEAWAQRQARLTDTANGLRQDHRMCMNCVTAG
jgi:heme-degrading monooxygenase HmoA